MHKLMFGDDAALMVAKMMAVLVVVCDDADAGGAHARHMLAAGIASNVRVLYRVMRNKHMYARSARCAHVVIVIA